MNFVDMKVRETHMFDATNIRKTDSGYLVATPRVGRIGIQEYRGSELGKPQLDVVRVWRPEEEVMSKDALRTLAHKPVTNNHPTELVTADNWKKHAVGSTDGEIARDGEFIRVPMTVMDGATVRDVEAGKKELSLGYTARLEWGAGTTPDGQQYDAKQTMIRINHLAIVDAARGGPKLVIGDVEDRVDHASVNEETNDSTEEGKRPMATRTIMADGIPCTMDEQVASIVERAIQRTTDEFTAFKKKTEEELAAEKKKAATDAATITTLTKAVETKDAELATVKKQLADSVITPAKLDQLVTDRSDTIGRARSILGDKLVTDGKTTAEMRRQVVDAQMGAAATGWSDEAITASFSALTKDYKPAAGTGAQDVRDAFSGQPRYMGDTNGGTPQNVQKAYDGYEKRTSEAWRNAGSTPVQQ